jgi:hypothetical protein
MLKLLGFITMFFTLKVFASTNPSQYVEGFRAEFKDKIIYKLGSRGPNHYDCSTSIAYLFTKFGMIKDLNIQGFRNGRYSPAYMERDNINFRVLKKEEGLKIGDLILMGKNEGKNIKSKYLLPCGTPFHWVVICGVDDTKQGFLQKNWKVNCIMEVKGGGEKPPLPKKYFDETWNHPKFKDTNLCAAVRHKQW